MYKFIKIQEMQGFIIKNAVWIVPVLVAIVSGVFYLIKKGGNNQEIGNIGNGSSVNQAGGNIEIKK